MSAKDLLDSQPGTAEMGGMAHLHGGPGPAGPPGTSEITYTAYQDLRERLTSDILNDPRLGEISMNGGSTCPQLLPTAASCKEIYDCNPNSPSGYYWRNSSPPERWCRTHTHTHYCAMNLTHCSNTTGGWTKVAHSNMTSLEGTCPSPLKIIPSPRSCSHSGSGCSSVYYPTLGIYLPGSVAKLLGISTTQQMLFIAQVGHTFLIVHTHWQYNSKSPAVILTTCTCIMIQTLCLICTGVVNTIYSSWNLHAFHIRTYVP